QWVAWRHDCTIGTARGEVRLAHALRDHLPLTAAHARAGRIGSDHVRALVEVAATSPARRDALASRVAPTPEVDDRGLAGALPGSEPHGTGQDAGTNAPAPTGEEYLLGLAATYPAAVFRR